MLTETEASGFGHDEMVQKGDTQYLSGPGQPARGVAILLRGRAIAGGMVMLCEAPSYVKSSLFWPPPTV